MIFLKRSKGLEPRLRNNQTEIKEGHNLTPENYNLIRGSFRSSFANGTILLRAGLFTQLLPVKIPADRYEMDFWINADKTGQLQ